MKATIDLPDELYRRVKVKSVLLGRPVREVTIELYERWLRESASVPDAEASAEWLHRWTTLADEVYAATSAQTTAREELGSDRDRLRQR